MKLFNIFAVVNPNAHNPRYGRDCHAPACIVGQVEAESAEQAQDMAYEQGMTYNPEQSQYEWLYAGCEITTGE